MHKPPAPTRFPRGDVTTLASSGILKFLLIFLIATLPGCIPPSTPLPTATLLPTPTVAPTQIPTIPAIPQVAVIQGHTFRLEVADASEKRTRGLAGRAFLPQDTAMLFIYDQESPLTFWMKDTLSPLDILFLDSQGYIVDIQTMEPQPGDADSELRLYTSREPARYAIEMNAGLSERYGFTVGMLVELR